MIRVFLCSPYAASETRTVEDNVLYARACLHDSLRRGESPFAPHLLYPQVLDDMNPEERERGLLAGLSWLPKAHMAVFYIDHGMSAGMQRELAECLPPLDVEFRSLSLDDRADVSGVSLLDEKTLLDVAHAMGIPAEKYLTETPSGAIVYDELRRRVRDWPYDQYEPLRAVEE